MADVITAGKVPNHEEQDRIYRDDTSLPKDTVTVDTHDRDGHWGLNSASLADWHTAVNETNGHHKETVKPDVAKSSAQQQKYPKLKPLDVLLAFPDTTQDDALARSVKRKVNRRILPWMAAIIVFCYIDRTNLAYASLQLNCDLGFTAAVYGLGTSFFYLSYAFFQLPSNILLVKFGCHLWLAVIMLVWGGIATCFAFIQNKTGFYALRFLLGVAEAGTFPGVFYYVKLFYSNSTITLPYTVIEVSAMASHILASPLAAALLSLDGVLGIHGWRWLFLLEGVPCVILGLILYWVLPGSIDAFPGLTNDERKWLAKEVSRDAPSQDPTAPASDLTWAQIREGFCHRKMWYIATVSALKNVALFGIFYWTPRIIQLLKDGTVRAVQGAHPKVITCSRHSSLGTNEVLLASIPFGTAAIWASLLAFNSHRSGERPLHIGCSYLFGAVMLVITGISLPRLPLTLGLILLTLSIAGMYGGNSIIVAHLARYVDGPVAAVVLALNNAGGNVGSFVGSSLLGLFLQWTGSYSAALCVLGVPILLSGLMALYMKTWDWREQAESKVDRKLGGRTGEDEERLDLLGQVADQGVVHSGTHGV